MHSCIDATPPCIAACATLIDATHTLIDTTPSRIDVMHLFIHTTPSRIAATHNAIATGAINSLEPSRRTDTAHARVGHSARRTRNP